MHREKWEGMDGLTWIEGHELEAFLGKGLHGESHTGCALIDIDKIKQWIAEVVMRNHASYTTSGDTIVIWFRIRYKRKFAGATLFIITRGRPYRAEHISEEELPHLRKAIRETMKRIRLNKTTQ